MPKLQQPPKRMMDYVTNFRPRLVQRIQMALANNTQLDREFGVKTSHIVAHRQSGKTWGVGRLVQMETAKIMAEREIRQVRADVDSAYPSIAFLAKTQKQARGIIWSTLTDLLAPWNPKCNNSTLEITIPRPNLGDQLTVSLKAYRNSDSLRGHKYRRIFCDEIQLATEEAITKAIIPTLSSVNGELFTSGTALPMGFYKPMIERSIKEGIPTALLPVGVTGVFNEEEQEFIKKEVGIYAWRQEYLLDFNAETKGSFYASMLTELERTPDFFTAVRNKTYPLIMAVDLGVAEGLVGLMVQVRGNKIEILDRFTDYDNLGEMRSDIEANDLFPDYIVLPWDSESRTLGKQKASTPMQIFREVFPECQIKRIERKRVEPGIERVRMSLHMLRFPPKDMGNTDAHQTLQSLKLYTRKVDKDGRITDSIQKNGHDHSADAIRYAMDFLNIRMGQVTTNVCYRAHHGSSTLQYNHRPQIGKRLGKRRSLLDSLSEMPPEIVEQIPQSLRNRVRS